MNNKNNPRGPWQLAVKANNVQIFHHPIAD